MSQFIPISKKDHANFSFRKLDNYSIFKTQHLCRVCQAEITKLTSDWPLVFVKSSEDKSFSLFAMQGFIPGQNLFINHVGKWLNPYIPAWNRFLPFSLIEDKNIIAYDNDLDCVKENPQDEDGYFPLFDKEKNISEKFVEHIEFMRRVVDNTKKTNELISELDNFDLITKWPIQLKFNDEVKKIDGIFRINKEKLDLLTSKNLYKLFQSKAIEIAYAQLYSIENLNKLAKRQIALSKANISVDGNLDLREKALARNKLEKTKELNQLVENLLSDE